jgi:two-component system, chemotaxis family, sensor kinase CheA
VVSDVTDELTLQRAGRAQAEIISAIEKAARDRNGFAAFVRETDGRLAASATGDVTPVELARHLHTLKGNFGLFGLTGLASLCHQLESQLADGSVLPGPGVIAPVAAAWQAFHERIDGLLGLSGRRTLVVDWAEYQTVLAAIDAAETADAPWVDRVRRWGQDPLLPHLERFGDQARQLAARLGKGELAVEITADGTLLDGDRFAPLWSVLVHTVRNAVDHGIEDCETRVAAGKPEHGRLALRGVSRGPELVIEVADDGAGVDWSAVASRAADRALPHATPADLCDALCADGLSTAETTTEVSGRGVGLGAVRATCMELGGHLEIDSQRGRGTTVRCVVPVEPPRAPARRAVG